MSKATQVQIILSDFKFDRNGNKTAKITAIGGGKHPITEQKRVQVYYGYNHVAEQYAEKYTGVKMTSVACSAGNELPVAVITLLPAEEAAAARAA